MKLYKLVLAEEPGWVTNTHMGCNSSPRVADSLVWPPRVLGMHVCTYIHTGKYSYL